MKTCQSTGYFQRVYIRSLLCFISSVVFAGSAQAFIAPNTINQCFDCHGSPTTAAGGGNDIRPVDSTYRNITTGAFVGNHRTHIPALTTNPQTCTPCHGQAPANMDHRDGLINMRLHINSSAVNVRGYYNKPVGSPAAFFNQTSAPQQSTCNNVNCHFRTTSPIWGITPLTGGQTVANCQVCHQSTGMNTGNHTKHITKFGSTISTCATCHPNQTTFTHATSAKAGRSITVNFAGAPSLSTGGTYAAGTHASYPNYFGTTGYGTCNTVYCHSSAQSATGGTPPVYKATTWGATLACNGCHGYNTPSIDLLTGSHSSHLNATYGFVCSDCHGADGSGTTANHANQTINVSLVNKGVSATYSGDSTPQNSNFGSCSTTVCHGSNSAAWGTAGPTNGVCTTCHGQNNFSYANVSSSQIAPGGTGVDTAGNTAATSARVGAHLVHLTGSSNMSAPMECGSCHIVVTSVQQASHLNFTTATITLQGLAHNGTKSPTATKTGGVYSCSSTYCHSANRPLGAAAGQSGVNTPPAWTNTTLIGGTTIADSCTAKCHNMPPGAGVSTDTHAALSAVTTFSGLSACSGCHSETLNLNPTSFATMFKDKTKHIDGQVQAAGGPCNNCHGYQSGTWGVSPVINAGGVGAHEKHVVYLTTKRFTVTLTPATDQYGSAATTWTNVCGVCHLSGTHMNGAVQVFAANNPTYFFGIAGSTTYNGVPGTPAATTAKTCSNISCHYFLTPSW